MGMEPGGRAAKLGQDYESLWVVSQMLRVVSGELISVEPEGLGPDERGVDLWVVRTDRSRQGQQCKRENGTKDKWTVASLAAERVLQNALFQIERDNAHRFCFVSSIHCPVLEDFVERVHRCNDSPEKFVNYELTSTEYEGEFNILCGKLGLDIRDKEDLNRVFRFLQRFRFEDFHRPIQSRARVEELGRLYVDGDPEGVVDVLKDFALQNIGNVLAASHIRKHLRDRGYPPRDLTGDPRVAAGIERLTRRFKRHFDALVPGNELTARTVTQEIWDRLFADDQKNIVFIHGAAGTGKTGVLRELINRLDTDKIPCLPLRLDQQAPVGDPERFGKDSCRLPGPPHACLAAYAGDQPCVLIIDQLDAIRWGAWIRQRQWMYLKSLSKD